MGLFVSPKRNDGYHNLRSLFLPITLYDELEFQPADEFSFDCTENNTAIAQNSQIGKVAENIVGKAYHSLLALASELPKYRIILHKKIPVQAGLGGGSSDAANTLLFLNQQLPKPLPAEILHKIALRLGSDVPFFLLKSPAYAEGRGEKLQSIPKLPSLPLLICQPTCRISTVVAFQLLDQRKRRWSEFPLKEVVENIVKTGGLHLEQLVKNDFFPVVSELYPELQSIKHTLQNSGALYTELSGSGSAIFAIYPDIAKRNIAAQQINPQIGKLICAETISDTNII